MNPNPFCVLSGYDEVQRISAQTASLFVPISRCCVVKRRLFKRRFFFFGEIFVTRNVGDEAATLMRGSVQGEMPCGAHETKLDINKRLDFRYWKKCAGNC